MGPDLILSCSKTGCDYSVYLEAEGFIPMNGNYYAISVTKDGTAAYASGPDGNIGKLNFF